MLNFNGYDKVVMTLRERLKAYDENIEVSTTAEGTHFPLVVVNDIDNRSINRTYGGIESYSLISIQIDIFARQQRKGNVVYSGRKITRDIAMRVDDVMSECLGMQRTSSRIVQNADTSIDRYVMIYNATQNDTKNYFL